MFDWRLYEWVCPLCLVPFVYKAKDRDTALRAMTTRHAFEGCDPYDLGHAQVVGSLAALYHKIEEKIVEC